MTNKTPIQTEVMMNKEEFEQKYSDVELYFQSYYKYRFTFKGEAEDGTVIKAGYGGGASEIYRYDVNAEDSQKVGDLEMNWHDVIALKDGEEIFEWHDARW